jgi:hypothetical protein
MLMGHLVLLFIISNIVWVAAQSRILILDQFLPSVNGIAIVTFMEIINAR